MADSKQYNVDKSQLWLMWNGISHKSFCPYSILIKTAKTNTYIFTQETELKTPIRITWSPRYLYLPVHACRSTQRCLDRYFLVVFASYFVVFFFWGGGGGSRGEKKLGGSMEHLIGIFSINQRALQLITELSYSIGELSDSIKESSCWIGELSNEIGECSNWIAELSIQLESSLYV